MRKFLRSFTYAFKGIIFCIKEERNFRFHLAVAFHLFVYISFFEVTKAEFSILVILCCLVLSLEAVNTALERAVDSTGIVNSAAGNAKDAAAGAVLIAAMAAVVCGVIILWQPSAFGRILQFYLSHKYFIIIQIALLAFWGWFVFGRRKS